jgi:hypothetical protein
MPPKTGSGTYADNGNPLSPGNLSFLTNISFFMALIGLLVNWTSGDAGVIPGLSIVLFSLSMLLIFMFAGFSQMHQNNSSTKIVVTQFLSNGSPVIMLISLVGWYLNIYRQNYEAIISNEMPDSWYTFSGLISLVLIIQLIQLYHLMTGLIHKKNWAKHLTHEGMRDIYKKFSSVEGIFMMIFTVVMAWLVMIEYIIATYYTTEG